MYECVVGKPPFEAPNPVGVLSKHLSQQPLRPSLRSPLSVPAEADDIIMRCLEKDLERRYESAEALRGALIGYLSTVGDDDWRTSRLGMRATGSGTRRVDSLFKPKRRGWWAVALLSILLLGVGGWHYVTRGPSEREPNHSEENANRLPEKTEMEAYLGQRLDEHTGDVDLFAIEHTGVEGRAAVVEVSSIPNMDVTLEVLEPGEKEPEVFTDTQGLGEGERLPNIPIEPGTYFIRVREKANGQQLPTENVSDEYYVRWELRDQDPDFERELNDSLELAESLPLRTDRRAWIGWPGDVDTFCLSEDADAVVAQVSALPGVDLVVRIVDRRTDRSGKHDANGVGRGETTKTWRNAKAGMLCVEVSAHPNDDRGAAAQPDETYGVRFIRAPGR